MTALALTPLVPTSVQADNESCFATAELGCTW